MDPDRLGETLAALQSELQLDEVDGGVKSGW